MREENDLSTRADKRIMSRKEEKTKKYYGHPDFYKIIDELKEIHSNKNHDYAGKSDPFKNFRLSELIGIPAWKGCLIRISDKFARLCNFAKSGELKVKDESVEDTFKDMAIYSIIGLILYRERLNG